jgi:hypothetical protein
MVRPGVIDSHGWPWFWFWSGKEGDVVSCGEVWLELEKGFEDSGAPECWVRL